MPLVHCAVALGAAGAIAVIAPADAALAAPVIMLLACGYSAVAMIARDRAMFWSPMPWFLVTCAVYFGIGPLSYTFAGDETVRNMDAFFVVDQHWMGRTIELNTVFVIVLCLTFYWLAGRRGLERIAPGDPPAHPAPIPKLLTLYLGVGLGASAIVASLTLANAAALVPGALRTLSDLTRLALVALTYLAVRDPRRYRTACIALFIYEINVGLLSLSKLSVLEVGIAALSGWYLARPSWRLLGTAALTFGLAYMALVPLVSFGRAELAARGPDADFTAAQLVASHATGADTPDQEESQTRWSRLSFANVQAFAMNQYDEGNPGTSLALALVAYVPRVLWPDKPVITPGAEFNYLATGSDESKSGPGIFAEAYWNFGWPGVLLTAIFVGWLFVTLTHVIRRHVVAERDLRWLALALYGIRLGYRPDDWFVSAYLSLPIMLLLTGGIIVAVRAAHPQRASHQGPAAFV